jgi:hypothetical protein
LVTRSVRVHWRCRVPSHLFEGDVHGCFDVLPQTQIPPASETRRILNGLRPYLPALTDHRKASRQEGVISERDRARSSISGCVDHRLSLVSRGVQRLRGIRQVPLKIDQFFAGQAG